MEQEILNNNGSDINRPSNQADYSNKPQSETEEFGMEVQEYLSVFRRRWRVMLGTALAVLILGMTYTLLQHPIYESKAVVLVNTGRSAAGGGDTGIPFMSEIQALTQNRSVDTNVEIMSSRDLLESVFNKLDPDLRRAGFGCTDMDDFPRWAVRIAPKRNTDIIEINVRAYTPKCARAMASGIARIYFEHDLDQNNSTVRQARKYAEEKMGVVQKQMVSANTDLARFKRETGLVAPDKQLDKVAEYMATMRMDLDKARADFSSGEQQTNSLRNQLKSERQDVVSSTNIERNPQFNDCLQRIDQLNCDRTTMLQEYTPQSDEVKALDNRIHSEENKLKQLSRTIVGTQVHARNPIRDGLMVNYAQGVAGQAALKAHIKALDNELAKHEQEIKALPEQERKLAELTQKTTVLQRTYDTLSDKYYTLLFSEQAMLPDGRMVSKARIAEHPSFPNRMLNGILFMMLGAMFGLAAIIITERLDSRVHSQESVERLTGITTLTAVPNVSKDTPTLIDTADMHSPILESFRILRNNITFAAIGRQLNILGVTSAGPGEGKSTVCVNLAMAMAADGKRVAVVDCDLRRPSAHILLNASRDIGFTNIVTGTCDLNKAIQQTSIDGLYFIPTGPLPPNPTEILNSQSSRQVFEELAERFDMVLVDCPPTSGMGDVQVISSITDGLLLVVSVNQTQRPLLRFAMRILHQVEAPLLGLVLNRVEAGNNGYNYYYYYNESEDGTRQRRRKSRAA